MGIATPPQPKPIPQPNEWVCLIYRGGLLLAAYGVFPTLEASEEFGQSATADVATHHVSIPLSRVTVQPASALIQLNDPESVDA